LGGRGRFWASLLNDWDESNYSKLEKIISMGFSDIG